jgi:RNA polymerase sigma-70 factor (ECF subfamily)
LGTPRLLIDGTGKLIGVMALDIAAGQVQAVSAIVNPDRLRHIGPIDDLRDSWRGKNEYEHSGGWFARG